MKIHFKILTLIAAACLVAFVNPFEHDEREAMILHGIDTFMSQVHFDPAKIDDELSAKILDTYIESLDSRKRFLLQSEIDMMQEQKYLIDDQMMTKTFELFNLSDSLMANALTRAQRIYSEIDTEQLDLNGAGSIDFDFENRTYPNSEQELKERWRNMAIYDIISKVENLIDKQDDRIEAMENADESDDDKKESDSKEEEEEEFVPKTKEELVAEAIEDHKEGYEKWMKRLDQMRRSDRFESYLNAITHQSDPHTTYFNPKRKQDFDINMGGKLEGIGARLQTDDDYTKVISVVPGGPAWKTKKIEVDDLITAVQQEGEEEVVSLSGMRIDDVVSKIRGKKGTVVILTIRKKDGSEITVPIERDEIIMDESFARSLIIAQDDVIGNIGYIKLPKFYSSFEKEGGNSCAKDVAVEIEKLKAQNVNGIIIDIRNNTGGSLNDVVEMSGLFIEDGPIVQVKPRERPAYVHKDKDSGVLYDGPLMILTNNSSASASEILAAAMQDYKRAIVVGTKSTYGKGTVQRFYDLDRAFRGAEQYKPLGSLKVTTQKFYRVNGGSTQLKGVIPDIILPDSYHYMDIGEKEYDHPLAWSEIAPVEYTQDVAVLNRIPDLAAVSAARIANHPSFNRVLDNAQRLKRNKDEKVYSLNMDQYIQHMDQREEEAEEYKDLFDKDVKGLQLSNLEVDMPAINSDESKQARNEDWLENLQKDYYLEESLHIMKDMITMEETFASIENQIKKK